MRDNHDDMFDEFKSPPPEMLEAILKMLGGGPPDPNMLMITNRHILAWLVLSGGNPNMLIDRIVQIGPVPAREMLEKLERFGLILQN